MSDRTGATDVGFWEETEEDRALERYRALVDTVDDGIYQLDVEGNFAAVNETVVEITGYSREELLGAHVSRILEQRDIERIERELHRRQEIDEARPLELEVSVHTAEGEAVPCEVRANALVVDGEVRGSVGIVRDVGDRRRQEATLASTRESYESITGVLDEADVGVFVLDEEFDIAWINEATERYFELDRDAVVGRNKRDVIGETIRERIADPKSFVETVLATYDDNSYVERFECQITPTGDRARRWLEHRSKPIESGQYAGGRVELYYDVTDRKRTEQALREREQQLQRERDLVDGILETSPVGIALVNPNGSTVRANERLAELLDVSVDDGRASTTDERELYDTIDDILPLEEFSGGRILETDEPTTEREHRLELTDTGHRWLSINATPMVDERDAVEQVVVTVTDITSLKSRERERERELEERVKELSAVQLTTTLFESIDRPMDALLQEFVEELPNAFQHPEVTAVRARVGDHVATTERFEPLERAITGHLETPDGKPITLEIVSLEDRPSEGDGPFLAEERELVETLLVLLKSHDERRTVIGDLREKTQRLEQFAYAASHDLQEPLRMVTSYLNLVERRYSDVLDEDGEEFIEFAVDGAQRMREMIDGLLAYSRVETRGDPFEPVDLNALVTDVRKDLERQIEASEAEITVESLPTVEGDSTQLRQLFQNLVANALEYSGDDQPAVHVSAEEGDSMWTISISDEGIGIDPDDADRIFDVFQRLHTYEEHAGTGIGLALCERIVERHGGEIWVDSAPGEGATFSFTLPAVTVTDTESG